MDIKWTGLGSKSGNPTDPGNWENNQLPQAGDRVYLTTDTMYLKGHTLDNTEFHLGWPSTSQDAPPGPQLSVSEGANLNLVVNGFSQTGNDVKVAVFGDNHITLTTDTPWPDDHTALTKATTTVTLADNATVTGTLNLHSSKFTMLEGANGTFYNDGVSNLEHTVFNAKITPDILGTGAFNMEFSNLEVGGIVGPDQDFYLGASAYLTIDHADQFKADSHLLQAGAQLTLKDFVPSSWSWDGTDLTLNQTGKPATTLGVDVANGTHLAVYGNVGSNETYVWTIPNS